MLTFNFQAPTYTYLSLVDHINYTYEEDLLSTYNSYYIKDESNSNKDVSTTIRKQRERILTYYRNEIFVMCIKNIAFIYIENSITYVVNMDGKKAIVNESLDSLFAELDPQSFFRVNRQIILSISAIEKIIRIGNKLKVITSPKFDRPIYVGKNKALAFKKWLIQLKSFSL